MFIKRNIIKIAGLFVFSFIFTGVAFAATPNLLVVKEGVGDSARVTISNADPYATINLFRRQGTTLWTTINNFGQTDGSGYFSQVASLGGDGSNTLVETYVVVNGKQSNIAQTYPLGNSYGNNSCGVNGCLSYLPNQRNLNLNLGQSQTVTFDPSVYGTPIYVSSNSNPSAVSASILSNYNIYFTALNSGVSNILVCQNNYNFCTTYLVTVGGATGSYGSLTFSQAGASLVTGQSLGIQIFSGYASGGTYYVSNNSNSSAVNAYISSTTLYLAGQNTGTSNITVCQYNTSACGTMLVTVTGSGAGSVSFNPASVQMVQGQSQTVTIFSNQNSYASYYVTGNTTNGAVVATLGSTSNTLNLFANASGSGQISVCQSGTLYCGTLYVNVGGNFSNVTLSQNSLQLQLGQSASVSIYGSGNFYVSSNSNPSVALPTVVNSQINIYASASGTSSLVICSQNGGNCVNLSVTVGGVLGANTGLYFSSSNLPQPRVGQYYSSQLLVYGGNAPYNFVLQSGNLPSGLSLSSNGQIFGTPVLNQSSSFTVLATDSLGRSVAGSYVLIPSVSYTSYQPKPAVLGASAYANGSLISENGSVYIVYKGTKTGFVSQSVFSGLGFKLASVQEVGESGLVDSGYTVTTTRTSHPWGTWIKNGKTIYFVSESGLIPVPDYATFLNNGGLLRNVVSANRYDFSLGVLPNMEFNDERLR